jgi:hypothetical protein
MVFGKGPPETDGAAQGFRPLELLDGGDRLYNLSVPEGSKISEISNGDHRLDAYCGLLLAAHGWRKFVIALLVRRISYLFYFPQSG